MTPGPKDDAAAFDDDDFDADLDAFDDDDDDADGDDADGDDDDEDAPASGGVEPDTFPDCPHCGDSEGACDHVFAVIDAGDELLAMLPEYGELDELAGDLQRLTLGGDAALEELSRRKDAWWLKPRGAGFGLSRRLAGADAVAARLGLVSRPCGEEGGSVLYAEDCAVARERLRGALVRVKRDLTTLGKRLGLDA